MPAGGKAGDDWIAEATYDLINCEPEMLLYFDYKYD